MLKHLALPKLRGSLWNLHILPQAKSLAKPGSINVSNKMVGQVSRCERLDSVGVRASVGSAFPVL